MGMSERDPVAAADDFRDALMRKAKDLSDDVLLHLVSHLHLQVLQDLQPDTRAMLMQLESAPLSDALREMQEAGDVLLAREMTCNAIGGRNDAVAGGDGPQGVDTGRGAPVQSAALNGTAVSPEVVNIVDTSDDEDKNASAASPVGNAVTDTPPTASAFSASRVGVAETCATTKLPGAADRTSDSFSQSEGGGARDNVPKRFREEAGRLAADRTADGRARGKARKIPLLQERPSTRRSVAEQEFKCIQLDFFAAFDDFDPAQPTHFIRRDQRTMAAEDGFSEVVAKIAEGGASYGLGREAQVMIDTLQEACVLERYKSKPYIRVRERGERAGFNPENRFVGNNAEYQNIGENPTTMEYKTWEDVAAFLERTLQPGYYGYVNIYLDDENKCRADLCHHNLTSIYTMGEHKRASQTGGTSFFPNTDQDFGSKDRPDPVKTNKTLPGGLKEKFKGANFQIFWNPEIRTCSGTHWDDNDSLLVLVQGKKQVQLAPKGAPLPPWSERGTCGNCWSRVPPKSLPGQHDEIILLPGEALFLPKGVWHRVTSDAHSLAFSFGVTTLDKDVGVFNDRLKAGVEDWKSASMAVMD